MQIKRLKGIGLKEVTDAGQGLAVFATMNVVDSDGDVTLPGAFGDQTAKLLPTHDWGHVPLGKTRIFESGDSAMAEFKLNLDIASARDWHSALKFDLADGAPLQEWSYGYDPVEFSFGDFNGQRVRFLKKLKVYEVSPVVLGAGEGTRTLTVKSAQGRKLADQVVDVREDLADLVQRVSELKALRAAEGRELSKERREQLAELKRDLDQLGALGIELAALAGGGEVDPVARQLFSDFVAITSARR